MVVQPGLCVTWSEPPKTGFLTTRLDSTRLSSTENTLALTPLNRVSKRGTVILRDNFDGSSLNRGEWDHEVSMYGGYVSSFSISYNATFLILSG